MWGFLILFGMILLWILFYWYFFIYSLINVQFQSNVSQYNISMDSTQKSYEQTCLLETCFIPNMLPFEYRVLIEKEGYKTLEYIYKPNKRTAVQNIRLEKDYQLEPVELFSQKEAIVILENQDKISTRLEKIEFLKEKNQVFYTLSTQKNQYNFKKKANGLALFQNNKFLGIFQNAKKSEIKLYEVIWNENYLFLELWKNNYLFSIQSWEIKKITFEIPINYIKTEYWSWEFIFVTKKGSFSYNSKDQIFSYNTFFSDYVVYQKNTYVWIIYTGEENKKQKFGLSKYSWDTIVQYNPENKEYTILLETEKKITKIFKLNWQIYFQDIEKNNFLLTHF